MAAEPWEACLFRRSRVLSLLAAMRPSCVTRNDLVEYGERARLASTGRRLADQQSAHGDLPLGGTFDPSEAIGGTPMAATGTVTLPYFNDIVLSLCVARVLPVTDSASIAV